MNIALVLIVIVLLLLGIFIITIYNGLVRLRIEVKEAWSQIDVQLKRRADLIPNLVETVKGYASHEKEVFERVTQARASLMSAQTPGEAEAANNMLQDALKSLFAVAEAYPDLKASQNFTQMQTDLRDTEDKIAYARQYYNATVRTFNQKIAVFPNNFVASLFRFKEEEFFEASEAERENVKVNFTSPDVQSNNSTPAA